MTEPLAKQGLRERVWRAMEIHGAARFPGAKGRIPNFTGAERAALRLQELPEWKRAKVVKINPDAAQLPVRRLALSDGKVLYMAVPRLRPEACFIELHPARLGKNLAKAATIKGAALHGRAVEPDDVPPLDLIVCGSVAVNERGARVGKGGGYSDLEYGLLRTLGRIKASTPVTTTVHSLQVVSEAIEMRPHDIVLDWIVTAEGPRRCEADFERPRGIYWEYLAESRIATIPALGKLYGRLGRAG